MLPFTSAQTLQAEAAPTPVKPVANEDQVPEGAGFEDALDVAASEDGPPLDAELDVDVVLTIVSAPTPASGQPPISVAPGFAKPIAITDGPSLPTMGTTAAGASSATPAKVSLPTTGNGSHAPATAPQTMSMTSAETMLPTAVQTTDAAAATNITAATLQSTAGAPSKETVTATPDTATPPMTTDRSTDQDQAARSAPVAQTQASGTRTIDNAPAPSASAAATNNASATPETSSDSTSRDRDYGPAERQLAQAKPIDRPHAPVTAAPMSSRESANNSTATEGSVPTTAQTGNNISVATPTTDAMTVAPSEAAPAVAAQPITSAGATPTQQARPLEIPDVSDLLEQVRVRLSPKRPEITVLLDPPELGRLFIKLAMKGGELAATVTVDNARVARLFEGDVGRLYRTLDEAGIRVVEVEIRTALDSSDDPENPWDEQRDGAGSEFGPDDRADVPHTRDVRGTSRSHQDSAQPSRTVAKSRASTLDLMI